MTDISPTTDVSKTTLSEGDIVRLNSGGPKMTVLQTKSGDTVKCQWFDRNGKIHTEDFTIKTVSIFIPRVYTEEEA